ncbi:hypothetical protein PACILC2_00290 [Paenibacillus cisolokensis]|uniref:PTS EIIC type-1 domain-containing protein n=1 Tax=Paenibacillus cisolokensis TaxID=1658519 RepID=A0ABQ4MZV4_9BACL|nr:hypothetical protein PACILC2_00290 [Paenibacillus cisolokensis]
MNFMGGLQQLGRSFMLPMIVLPGAAVFLSLSELPWDRLGFPGMSGYLLTAGQALFLFLPYLFALGVALGMSGNSPAPDSRRWPACLFTPASSAPATIRSSRACSSGV